MWCALLSDLGGSNIPFCLLLFIFSRENRQRPVQWSHVTLGLISCFVEYKHLRCWALPGRWYKIFPQWIIIYCEIILVECVPCRWTLEVGVFPAIILWMIARDPRWGVLHLWGGGGSCLRFVHGGYMVWYSPWWHLYWLCQFWLFSLSC